MTALSKRIILILLVFFLTSCGNGDQIKRLNGQIEDCVNRNNQLVEINKLITNSYTKITTTYTQGLKELAQEQEAQGFLPKLIFLTKFAPVKFYIFFTIFLLTLLAIFAAMVIFVKNHVKNHILDKSILKRSRELQIMSDGLQHHYDEKIALAAQQMRFGEEKDEFTRMKAEYDELIDIDEVQKAKEIIDEATQKAERILEDVEIVATETRKQIKTKLEENEALQKKIQKDADRYEQMISDLESTVR